jgi:ribosomal protein S18 acetylase RimI-like enzyme
LADADIRLALDAAGIGACRVLLEEYQVGLGVSLCFQGFDRELAGLPGDYATPRGGLWLATVAGVPAGCVALRPLASGAAELKRLYVRPANRGSGLGARLARLAVEAARNAGYGVLKLDTLPSMGDAQRLYERMGFTDTAPYNDNPVDGVRFLALSLAGAPQARSPSDQRS